MNAKVEGAVVYVALSRRNLRDLLANEDGRGLVRTCENGVTVVVRVESDAAHYGERVPGPGISADDNE